MGINALFAQRHVNRHWNKCTVCKKGMEINALFAKRQWKLKYIKIYTKTHTNIFTYTAIHTMETIKCVGYDVCDTF